jgi:hypothetical protein
MSLSRGLISNAVDTSGWTKSRLQLGGAGVMIAVKQSHLNSPISGLLMLSRL